MLRMLPSGNTYAPLDREYWRMAASSYSNTHGGVLYARCALNVTLRYSIPSRPFGYDQV